MNDWKAQNRIYTPPSLPSYFVCTVYKNGVKVAKISFIFSAVPKMYSYKMYTYHVKLLTVYHDDNGSLSNLDILMF